VRVAKTIYRTELLYSVEVYNNCRKCDKYRRYTSTLQVKRFSVQITNISWFWRLDGDVCIKRANKKQNFKMVDALKFIILHQETGYNSAVSNSKIVCKVLCTDRGKNILKLYDQYGGTFVNICTAVHSNCSNDDICL